MAKSIGFSRFVRIEWLDKTVELVLSGKSNKEISNELLSYLSLEINDKTNLLKTRNILMNIWVTPQENTMKIKELALNEFSFQSNERLVLHWCMCLLAYPVFRDIAQIIGRSYLLQESFNVKSIKMKLFDLWGERSTLFFSLSKILQTMKYLNIIENIETGVYKPIERTITKNEYVLIILLTILSLNRGTNYELYELQESTFFFAFKYNPSYEVVENCKLLAFDYYDGKRIIVLK